MLKPLHHKNLMTFMTNQPLIEGPEEPKFCSMHTAMATAKEVPYKCTCTLGADTGFNYMYTLHDQCLWFQSEIEDFFISTSYKQDRQSLYFVTHVVFTQMIY